MLRFLPRARAPRVSSAAPLLLALLVPACETPVPGSERAEETNQRLLDQLLSSDALEPVDQEEFEAEHDYGALEQQYRDSPRARDVLAQAEDASTQEPAPAEEPEEPPPFNPYLE